MARVTKKSILSGVTRTLELKRYDQDEFEKKMIAVEQGKVSLTEAFPDISNEAQDFIVYGTTKEEWERYNAEGENAFPLAYNTP